MQDAGVFLLEAAEHVAVVEEETLQTFAHHSAEWPITTVLLKENYTLFLFIFKLRAQYFCWMRSWDLTCCRRSYSLLWFCKHTWRNPQKVYKRWEQMYQLFIEEFIGSGSMVKLTLVLFLCYLSLHTCDA